MRQIIRFCASCYRNGVRTELPDAVPGVVIIIGKYGAHTDLCDDCEAILLNPLLEMMSSGEDLTELTRTDWAQLGSVMPTNSIVRRRIKTTAQATQTGHTQPSTGRETAETEPAAAMAAATVRAPIRCTWCGQTFTRAENLRKHLDNFGDRPHEQSSRRGAAQRDTETAGPPAAESVPAQVPLETVKGPT